MSLQGQVAVEGLGDLRRTLRQIDRGRGDASGLPAFRDHLREAADIVVDEAKRRAPRGTKPIPPGRSPRKRLVDTIRPRVRGDVALVRAGAIAKSPRYPRGYRYARRIEYEAGGARAFLGPAIEAKSAQVARHMEGVLDAIERKWRD